MKQPTKEYLKQLDTGKWVIDFDKLYSLPFPIIIIMSERGRKGKTFGAIELALDHYEKDNNHRTIWLLNTEKQWVKQKLKFLKNNKKISNRWDDYTSDNPIGVVNSTGDNPIEYWSLSTAEKSKGARDSTLKNIFYDEFNVGLDMLKWKQTELIDNLLATATDQHRKEKKNPLKLFIFANNKSLYTPLFINWNILKLDGEITEIYDDYGKPLIFIYLPDADEYEVEQQTKDDWTAQLSKRSGEYDHIFLNKSLYDNISGIHPDLSLKEFQHISTFAYHNNNFDIYKNKNNKKQYYIIFDKKSKIDPTVAATTKDIINGIKYSKEFKLALFKLVVKNNIIYDSIVAKEAIYEIIR